MEKVAVPLYKRKDYRITSIDLLRGIVMIIMALDHTRDIFHKQSQTGNPLDLNTTWPALFLTRWITHFCAPVFVFLAGTSIYLQRLRKSKMELRIFLVKRGLWLIVVDLLIMSFVMTFNIHYALLVLEVLWAIGAGMILTAIAMYLPYRLILFVSVSIVFGHNLLDIWEKHHGPSFPVWYSLLHRQGFYPIGEGHILGILYPLLPWVGIILSGYCFGKVYEILKNHKVRSARIMLTGGILIIVFLVVRLWNSYGDPVPWSVQKNGLYTFLSFINIQKYPPSLLFTCATLGPALIVLGALDQVRNKLTGVLSVYGQVPFFYFINHFFVLQLLNVVFFAVRGHSISKALQTSSAAFFPFIVPGEGVSLGAVYFIWIGVVILMYPLCKWFSNYKKKHDQWWLSYL